MTKFIIAPFALLMAVIPAGPAIAQSDQAESIRVTYADLNLAAIAGQQTLQRRIRGAARFVCGNEYPKEFPMAFELHACRLDAVARARPAYEQAVAAARRGTVTVLDAASLVVTSR